MSNKLQELTDKLYNEGLTKGKEEAESLITSAQKNADNIVRRAKKEAEDIVIQAKKEAEDLKQNAETEIKLVSRQVINEVKQAVENMILIKSLNTATKQTFNDIEFVQSLVKTITENYKTDTENLSFSLMVPEKQQEEFVRFIENKISKELSSGIEIKADKHLKEGFKIMPNNEGYYLSFTDEAFNNLFKAYLRPILSDLLFELKK